MTRHLLILVATLAFAGPALAQGLFSPAIKVDNSVITNFEIQQRILFLKAVNTPGNLNELAREQLVEDRLKVAAARLAGLALNDENLQGAMGELAGRANMSVEQFTRALRGQGVEQQTFREYVRAAVTWREFIRLRYGARAQISDAEIDRALAATAAGSGVRVLLSEIILAAPPQQAALAQAEAERLAKIRSTARFSQEAARLSASQSRENGGRLDWVNINELPAPLRGPLLALQPGEVTSPINIPNAIILFQMRAIQETARKEPTYAAIEYAVLQVPAGKAEAEKIGSELDNCDDLYGVAKGKSPDILERTSLPPGDIPQGIAIELAKLDADEYSTSLGTESGGALLIMLCGRTADVNEEASREAIANRLRSQRLAGYADSLLADLKARATIVEQ